MNALRILKILPGIIMALTFMVLAIGMFVFVYLKYFKKPNTEEQDEEQYKSFKREDISTYIPVKEIRSKMVLMEDGYTYLAAVICRGFDFFYAHPQEQYETNAGYLGFVNSIKEQVQMHINTKQFDLEPQINSYLNEQLLIEKKLMEIFDEAVFMQKNFDRVDSDTKKAYAEKMVEYDKEIDVLEWQIEHIENIVAYLKEMTSEKSTPVREISYIISWQYDPSDFPENTTEHDIILRATKELGNRVEQMRHALSNANVRVHRADDRELVEIMRNHFRPLGKNIYKASDLEKTNLDELIVTSTSLEDSRKSYLKYKKEVDEYMQRMQTLEKREGGIA